MQLINYLCHCLDCVVKGKIKKFTWSGTQFKILHVCIPWCGDGGGHVTFHVIKLGPLRLSCLLCQDIVILLKL